jgi:cytochrome P450
MLSLQELSARLLDSTSSTELQPVHGLIAALVAVAAAYAIAQAGRSSVKTPKLADGTPLPQPTTTLPVIGNTLDFIKNNDIFHDWISDLVQQFGDKPFVLRAPGRPNIIVISTPEAFEDVTKTQYDNFGKGEFLYDQLHDLLGRALTIVDGDKWRYQRKIFANLFSVRQLRDVMQPVIRKHGATLHSIFTTASNTHEPFDLFRLFNRFTMESFSEIAFGIQMGSLASGEDHPFETAFDAAQEISTRRFAVPVWYWKLERLLTVGPEGELKRSMKEINKTVLHFISESMARRERGETRDAKDIVSLVLDSVGGETIDPELLRSIVIAALVGGRDTSAQTMSWFVHVISQHPEVEQKVREEIFARIPALEKNPGYFPTMEEVQDLPYLEACLKETLRLYPAASFNVKHCFEDTFLSDGTFVPGDSQIGLPYWAMGRRASIWGDDCNEFKPERFLDPETGKLVQVSPFKFNAFHAGPRICLGMNLALMEMKTIVAGLLSRFHIAPVPGQIVTYTRSISLPMRNPFMVRIEPVAFGA